MRKQFKGYIFAFLALATVLVGMLGASFVFANNHQSAHAQTPIGGSGKPASMSMLSMHVVDMQKVPAEATSPLKQIPTKALPIPAWNPTIYAQVKQAAAQNKNAPVGMHAQSAPANATSAGPYTPSATKHFQGIADSTSVCPYFGGCQPPDQALAASSTWVFQGVNTSFAVYSVTGTLQTGWPKNSQSFFGVPNPGSCDPKGPFMSDPRAFYDPNDGRFWVAMLQVEGIAGLNSCPELTLYWIAVSQTSDPRGLWNIYNFDMRAGTGTTNYADFVQFGFDQQAIYFSANMFNKANTAYQYAEIFAAKKSSMEKGLSVSFFGFLQLSVSSSRTVLVDTVEPVETEAHKYGGPNGGLFINAFNGGEVHQFNGDPFGDDCISTSCHGLAIWTLTKPGTSSTTLSFAFVDTASYILPPSADEPGCSRCVDTFDTRISGTPPYHNGLISFALETSVNNGTQNVPGIFWGQVAPEINDNGTLAGAALFQRGYYFYGGDSTASYGALMPDADGDLFMVFDFMNSTTNPEIAFTARRVAFSFGLFHDGGLILRAGDASTTDSRWGDYSATSYDGSKTDNVWFSGEYAPASGPINGDWSTFIGQDKFCTTCN
jgi:hypothetical protein